MFKYLYLTKQEWAEAWINGGEIPISLASTYLHDKREGVLTPDENLIHDSSVDLKSLSPFVHFAEDAQVKNFTMTGCRMNGKAIPNIKNANYYKEDGIILSFCNTLSESVATKLGKECCVKITNFKELKNMIDDQIGVKGIMRDCEYTADHRRNHFLKSTEDKWQQEFRMFWPFDHKVLVTIPKGHGKLVGTYKPSEV